MKSGYTKEFDRWVQSADGNSYIDLRQKGFDQFLKSGFPGPRDEHWRFTNVSHLNRTNYVWSDDTRINKMDINKIVQSKKLSSAYSVLLINGKMSPSDLNLPDYVFCSSFDGNEKIQPSVIRNQTPFTHWNEAFFKPGLCLEIPPDTVIDKPIQLFWVNTFEKKNEVVHTRCNIIIGESSKVEVLDQIITLGNDPGIVNHVCQSKQGENSQFEYVKMHDMTSSHLFYNLEISQENHSKFSSTQLTLGSSLSRYECSIFQDGIGCNSELYVLGLQDNKTHTDYQTIIHHNKTDGISKEIVKNILRGSSRAVFNGKIIVEKNAQKTNASQTNKNIILSQQARVNTNPQLEINADDVVCSHGSTTGELDDDALFYLQSRGIERESALALMISGFAGEILDQVSHPFIREMFQERLDRWLVAS